MIIRTNEGFQVKSHSGKNLGSAKTLGQAKKRMAQVEYHKRKGNRKLGVV